MKNILILGAIIIVVLGLILVLGGTKDTAETLNTMSSSTDTATTIPQSGSESTMDENSGLSVTTNSTTTVTTTSPDGKLKADTFTGMLTKVDTGCFADGECFVVVDGKKVTALIGFSTDIVGKVMGVESFGDLEQHIGKQVEVYAQVMADGTYTLYGSEGFYIKAI